MGTNWSNLQQQQQQTNANLDRIKYYFASRLSTFDDIWNISQNLSEEIGEQVLDIFCLTLIDHWDKEKERYVLLCERCLIMLEYDFERLQIRQLHLYDYSRFDTIRIGPICYPEMSFNSISHRYQMGIRFGWDCHKAIRRRYSIEMFHDKLFEVLNSFQQCRQREIPNLMMDMNRCNSPYTSPPPLNVPYSSTIIELYHPDNNITIVHYAPIYCENYFNLAAAIFNHSRLGYYRLRLF
ncbi:hypothetical protein RDWZM_006583 [Blomia tropicalis]|uniref:Inositol phosphatase domain-containing protein n=1 Tax=Blomia tropicalis TaxID=40697 RepID=A0A9Q0M7C3_BLOTA|nr:hypothetical protein RDWZM_006583 [Blomia tropicalis]